MQHESAQVRKRAAKIVFRLYSHKPQDSNSSEKGIQSQPKEVKDEHKLFSNKSVFDNVDIRSRLRQTQISRDFTINQSRKTDINKHDFFSEKDTEFLKMTSDLKNAHQNLQEIILGDSLSEK